MTEDDERERTLQQGALKRLMEQVQRDQNASANEKKMVMLIGLLVLALVATVGLAMLMRTPKEQDLARSRCEMEQSVALVWKETEALKAANPGITQQEIREKIEPRRPEFKEAAKASCAQQR